MKYVYNTINGVAIQEFDSVPQFECWELTEQIESDLIGKVKPQIIDGVVSETATQEEIEQSLQGAVPLEVALWKLRFILSQMELETVVGDVINQLPEPQKTAAKYLWERGIAVDRYSPTVDLIKQSIGLTNSDVDYIFRQANLITL